MQSVLRSEKKFLVLLFLFSLLIRAGVYGLFLRDEKILTAGDSWLYHTVATNMAHDRGFTNNDGSPHFVRLPGYSTFLALSHRLISFDITKALWLQVLLACFIPLLVFFLSLLLFPGNIILAKFVSIVSALHLGFILFSGLAMSETLFLLLFLLFSLFFFSGFVPFFSKRKIRSLSIWHFLFAGMFLGCASLVRTAGLYVVVLVMILFLFSRDSFSGKLQKNFFLFLGWFLVVSWWLARNFILTGYFFFHTFPGMHFLKHSAARLAMEKRGCSYAQGLKQVRNEFKQLVAQEEKRRKRQLLEIERCRIAERLSLTYFVRNPLLSLRHVFVNMFKTVFSLYSGEILFIDSGGKLPSYESKRNMWNMLSRFLFPNVSHRLLTVVIYGEILFFLFLMIGFCGALYLACFDRYVFEILCCVIPFIIIFIGMTLSCGFARLRLPIEPFLLVLSGMFWIRMFLKSKRAG